MKSCPTCNTEWPDETKFCPNDGSTLRAAAGSVSLIGSVVADRYHIVKKLGEGGMGAVYLGEHVKMGRKSAIKVMTQNMAHDADAIARFNREAANAARINHPNVCAIYDFGETPDGLIYLAMEFIEGEALTAVIQREGALSPKRAGKILQQTGDALQAAHDLGIVHRDLKPDNIMLAKARDGGDVVKVVDFGIAKAMGGSQEGQNVTKTGLVVGTPEYMSPEQLSGDKLDGRSDIYSLALVFFRTLTGTLPFQADSAQETMIKRLTDDPMRLNDAMPGVTFPAKLQEIMDHALARMPSDRYAAAAEFARDVTQVVSGMGDLTPVVTPEGATIMMDAAEAAAMAKTRIGGPAASATRAQGAAAAPTPQTPAPRTMPLPRTSTQSKIEKKTPVLAIVSVVAVLGGVGAVAGVMLSNKGSQNPADPSGVADPQQKGQLASGGPTTPVTSNTAKRGGTPNTGGSPPQHQGDSGARGNDRGGGAGNGAANPGGAGTLPLATNVDVANAGDRLDQLLNRLSTDAAVLTPPATAQAVRDSALMFFNAAGIGVADKAFAAYVAASAFASLENKGEAIKWANEAVRLQPSNRAYLTLVNSLTGNQ